MPNIPLVAELGTKCAEFQRLLNTSEVPEVVKKKLRPSMDPKELFTSQDSRIFVRCRPIIPFDQEDMNSKSIIRKVDGYRDPVVMSPKISLAGQCTIEPHSVTLDGVFCGGDDTERVYMESCAPLVHLSVEGASTCVLCYGQTGSGKTHTTLGIVGLMSRDLAPYFASHNIFITVIEIQANKNIDLLTGSEVQVVEDISGELKIRGTDGFECSNDEMLLAVFQEAASQRMTKATGRNEVSSRSHMVTCIQIICKNSTWVKPGELFIVDLAGSENTADSATHDKERQMEAKFINTSLMTLKECIRARAMAATSTSHLHIPFRRSPLTLLLRDCFEIAVKRPTKTVVIACVSPLLRDSRHTINTLRYASLLAVTVPARIVADDPDDPNGFDREQALAFICRCSRGRITNPEYILPEGDGRTLVHIPEAEFIRRIMESHAKISEKGAKQIYTSVWQKIVDARTKGRKVMTSSKKAPIAPRCATQRR
ncbi:Kinesin-13 6, putative [Trypanosoma equiperdum]|uniref:Kinesin-like protein n=4 Tax=Trypanozoon TaxID=39700 RepID=Q38E15_TRYB2|nr:MCAK-like kinesin, putative [Trypanosoma brucei gambiense DAL972]XP_827285.1 MCAK-like kinesin, putative [Trypanosoma brucei brucei TREU927]RHW70543.1 Kinesin-13 6 [Trypanosoma brucei equiperdum]SCU72462.1 Kinesin-13 6, putative [Trypanosoma equiperdum]EAN76955.1 MCAK-like kinesin, putative [Trypanosoma brucei brucei TREU927]CBH14492.1 MCAK-like kinesin, putative [Trypanosoma brucei gambiense DAL972]|eukprot:XP_011776758.1 MCAK-like kinesin, putative [Trypanosoma brucei gambiense DAL972]